MSAAHANGPSIGRDAAGPPVKVRSALPGMIAGAGVMANLPVAASPVLVSVAHHQFGLNAMAAGALATTFLLTSSLTGLAAAPFVQMVPPRRGAAVCFAVFIAVNLLAMTGLSLAATMILLTIAGIAAGAAGSISARLVACSPQPDNVAARIGIVAAIVLIVFGAAGGWAGAQYGAQGLHLVIALTTAVFAPALLTLPSRAAPNSAASAPAQSGPLIWLLLGGVLLYAVKDGIGWSLTQLASADRGFDAGWQGALLAGAGLAGIAGAAIAVLVSRMGYWAAALAIGVLVNAGLSTAQFLAPGPGSFGLLVALTTGSHLFVVPFVIGLSAWLDPRGRLAASAVSLIAFGTAAGPIIGGELYGDYGVHAVAVTLLTLTLAAGGLWLRPGQLRLRAERTAGPLADAAEG